MRILDELPVAPPLFTDGELVIAGVLLTLIIGMSFLVLGYWKRKPMLVLFSGLVWVFGSVSSMWGMDRGEPMLPLGWGIFCLGLGLFLMYSAASDLTEEGDS